MKSTVFEDHGKLGENQLFEELMIRTKLGYPKNFIANTENWLICFNLKKKQKQNKITLAVFVCLPGAIRSQRD